MLMKHHFKGGGNMGVINNVKALISTSKLTNLANAIRNKTGEVKSYTIDEMIEKINGMGSSVLTSLNVTTNGTYTPESGVDGFNQVNVDVNPDLRPLSVSENGTYQPDGFDGYESVVVDVHNHGYSEDYDDFSGGNILALISHKDEYINTGYYPKVCTEYFLKATKDKTYTTYENLFASLFGSIGTRIGIQMNGSSLTNVGYYATSGSSVANIPSSLSADVPTILSTRHLVSADPDTVATKPLLIFYGYYNTGFDRKGQFNSFGLKCYEFGTLVKKYVPWLDENNVPCVRELVDDEYFYNVGTGAFGYIDLEGNVHDA